MEKMARCLCDFNYDSMIRSEINKIDKYNGTTHIQTVITDWIPKMKQ